MRLRNLGQAIAFTGIVVACSSSEGGPSTAPKTVRDKSGRTCTLDSNGFKASCDRAPAPGIACTVYPTACSTTSTSSQKDGALICDGCCNDNTVSIDSKTCSPIVCQSPSDCPQDFEVCRDGACFFK